MRMRELDLKQERAQNFLDPEKKKQLSEQHEFHANTGRAHTPSGHVNWRSCSVF